MRVKNSVLLLGAPDGEEKPTFQKLTTFAGSIILDLTSNEKNI